MRNAAIASPVPIDDPLLSRTERGSLSCRVLAVLLLACAGPAPAAEFLRAPRRMLDEAGAAAAGIRKLSGKHVTLFTDLDASETVDELPAVFDLAFPQWCAYFGQDARRLADWRVTGFLMRDKGRFLKTRLMPDNLPPFAHGYTLTNEFWLYDQSSDYYRRHLFLHEGTHAFMFTVLGSCGPPWYMEGMAEMLATHRWHEGKLEMNHFPGAREEAPMWGRIKIIRDGYDARQAKTLRGVLQYGPQAHRETEPYAWCWAAATLLDRHPHYAQRFRHMTKLVRQADFNDQFLRAVGDDWDALAEEWQVFIDGLEYGTDVARTAIDFTPGKPLNGRAKVAVAADRGWQNSGLRLEAGATYQLRASGRYQVADKPRPWPCEPNGVSIRYYKGRPLGILLAAVHPDGPPPSGPSPLISPTPIGLGQNLTPKLSGTLFFRINDSNGELADNAGSLSVEVVRAAE